MNCTVFTGLNGNRHLAGCVEGSVAAGWVAGWVAGAFASHGMLEKLHGLLDLLLPQIVELRRKIAIRE